MERQESTSQGVWSEAPEWADDKTVPECAACNKSFTITRRRHHCRGCGGVFCDDCSTKRKELPEGFKLKGKQRVCDNCFFALVQAEVANNPDEHPPKPDFAVVRTNLLEELKKFIAETAQASWTRTASNKVATIYTKKMPGSALVCVKSEALSPTPLQKTWAAYNNKDLWKNWQPDMKECRTIEQLSVDGDGFSEEVLYVMMNVPVVDNRDSVVYSAAFDGNLMGADAKNSRSIMSKSVTHPMCPRITGTVRAELNFCLTTFTEEEIDGQKHTRITSILHTDPKGLIPPFVVNQGLARGCDQIRDMVKFIASLP
eukprot:m.22237 g.22237  ORF g.22237 m.22237 type:complete len:314 (+) comp9173_c0_seq1:90-1031(+)